MENEITLNMLSESLDGGGKLFLVGSSGGFGGCFVGAFYHIDKAVDYAKSLEKGNWSVYQLNIEHLDHLSRYKLEPTNKGNE
jgi:hypothetical protein